MCVCVCGRGWGGGVELSCRSLASKQLALPCVDPDWSAEKDLIPPWASKPRKREKGTQRTLTSTATYQKGHSASSLLERCSVGILCTLRESTEDRHRKGKTHKSRAVSASCQPDRTQKSRETGLWPAYVDHLDEQSGKDPSTVGRGRWAVWTEKVS